MNDPRRHRALPDHPDAYDEYCVLRVPFVRWLVMAFAVHPETLRLLGHRPQSGAEFACLTGLADVYALLATGRDRLRRCWPIEQCGGAKARAY